MAERVSDRESELEAKARDVARKKFSDIAILIYREQTNGMKGLRPGKARGKDPLSPSPSIISLQVSPFLSTHSKLDRRHSRNRLSTKAEEEDDSTFGTWPKIRERAANVKAHSLVGSPVVPRYRHAPLKQPTLSVPAYGRTSGSANDIGPGFFKAGSEGRDVSPELYRKHPKFASIFDEGRGASGAQSAWQGGAVQRPDSCESSVGSVTSSTVHPAPQVSVPRIVGSEVQPVDGSNVVLRIIPDPDWSKFEPSLTSPGYDKLAPVCDGTSKYHLRPSSSSRFATTSATVT